MKFNVAKPVLLDGLRQVTNVVSSRPSFAVLSNVLITASKDNGLLTFTATDLDVCVRCSVPAQVAASGSITLPAKKFFSIVNELPDAEVSVSVDDKDTATVRCERSMFKLLGLPAHEFPDFPSFEETSFIKVKQDILKESLKRTMYAIAPDDARYVLNGMLLSLKDGKMTLVATDGRRLAHVQQELEFPESQETEAILPSKTVNELFRILGLTGDVIIKLSANQVCFDLGDTLMISKLLEGNYPNYKQVIPAGYTERIVLPREEFLDIVRRVSLLSIDKINSIKLTFANGELRVDANSSTLGEAHEPFPIDYTGQEMAISFNPEFLMAALKSINCDTINFDLVDKMSPGVIRVGDEFLYVIMPMRIS